jgi:hypothetical protein
VASDAGRAACSRPDSKDILIADSVNGKSQAFSENPMAEILQLFIISNYFGTEEKT